MFKGKSGTDAQLEEAARALAASEDSRANIMEMVSELRKAIEAHQRILESRKV